MPTKGKKAFFLGVLSSHNVLALHYVNKWITDGESTRVGWSGPHRSWAPYQSCWTHATPYIEGLTDMVVRALTTEDSHFEHTQKEVEGTYDMVFKDYEFGGKLVDIHAVEFLLYAPTNMHARVCIEFYDEAGEMLYPDRYCVSHSRYGYHGRHGGPEEIKNYPYAMIAADEGFRNQIIELSYRLHSNPEAADDPPVKAKAWKNVAKMRFIFPPNDAKYLAINLFGNAAGLGGDDGGCADADAGDDNGDSETPEETCDCKISHVKGFSDAGMEIMVNMLEIGNNTPNEEMLVAAGFQPTTSEVEGVWYMRTIPKNSLDQESGVDADGNQILTLKYTLQLRTKDAHQIDDETVYKEVTSREIVFSAIVNMESQTITSGLPVQEPNEPTLLTRSLMVSPPLSLTVDLAEVAMGAKVEFDIQLTEFGDMFTVRARKCSVQCKSAHCLDKEVCLYGCDGAEPFCHQPFAEFKNNPTMDGQQSFAKYSYTAFKWETEDESDVDEQVIVCEVELWGTDGMAYNPTGEPQRDCV